jgi:hypothetical protein
MIERVVTLSTLFGLGCILYGAALMLRVVRIHRRGKPAWHLLVSSPAYLDLSAYPPAAVRLAHAARLCWFVGMASLVVAGVLKVLVESQVLNQ